MNIKYLLIPVGSVSSANPDTIRKAIYIVDIFHLISLASVLRCIKNQIHWILFHLNVVCKFHADRSISNVPLAHTRGNANFIFMKILPFYLIFIWNILN